MTSSESGHTKLTREQFAQYLEDFGYDAGTKLTKRELFAIQLMAARRSNGSYNGVNHEILAEMAVAEADVLIEELAK